MAKDSWLLGTGLSAPVVMLVAQTATMTYCAATGSQTTAAMTAGYVFEEEFRTTVTPTRWDRAVTGHGRPRPVMADERRTSRLSAPGQHARPIAGAFDTAGPTLRPASPRTYSAACVTATNPHDRPHGGSQ